MVVRHTGYGNQSCKEPLKISCEVRKTVRQCASKNRGTGDRGTIPLQERGFTYSTKVMASDGKNRNSLACKFCLKVTNRLPMHLRQACKKDATDTEISSLVEEAKIKMRTVARNLSVISYKELKAGIDSQHSIDFFVNFLEKKGSFITDKPQQTTVEEEEISPPSPPLPPRASVSVRRGMSAAGLYEKHSLKKALLKGYYSYLKKNYSESKHEVENIARFLYFMDKDECRVDCLHNAERAVEFFKELSTHTTSAGTVRNYLNGVKKFTKYIHSERSFFENDSSLHASLVKLQKKLDDFRKSFNKNAKEIMPEMRKATTPEESVDVIKRSLPHFRSLIDSIFNRERLEEKDYMNIVFFLETLLVIEHLHKPSVIQNLTVKNWLERTYEDVTYDGVEIQAAVLKVDMCPDEVIVMTEDEESWFNSYFILVRPLLFNKGKEQPYFFLSSKGVKVSNPSNDIRRFQQRFGAFSVTGQEARSIYVNFTLPKYEDIHHALIKKNLKVELTGSPLTFKQQIMGAVIVVRHQMDIVYVTRQKDQDTTEEDQKEKEIIFQEVERRFPVGVEGDPPSVNVCRTINELHGQYCHDRWRRQQKKMRICDVIARFKYRRPTKRQISEYIESQGWMKNVPAVEEILISWKEKERDADNDEDLRRAVTTQQWSGLVVVADPTKGETVFTQKEFEKGQVVCDYHGSLISARKGKKLVESMKPDEMGCLFFFRDKSGRHMCINAQTVPCPCHPELTSTIGRKINHSRKNPNLKPKLTYFDQDPNPHILFVANYNLDVGTELLLDYSVNRTLFNAKWADLPWMNE